MEILKTGPYGLREMWFDTDGREYQKLVVRVHRKRSKQYEIWVQAEDTSVRHDYLSSATKLGNKAVNEAAEWLLLMTQARMA